MSDDFPEESNKPSFENKTIFDKRLSDRPERFEDLLAWQEARKLTNRLYEITDKQEFSGDLGVRSEIRRTVVEVMSHLAAAVEGGGDRDFSRGLTNAKASAAALRSLLYVAIDRSFLNEQEQTELVGRAASIGRMITSQIARIKRVETVDFKRKGGRPGGPSGGGGYGGRKPGGYGPKRPYGSGGDSGGDRPGKPKYRPKQDE